MSEAVSSQGLGTAGATVEKVVTVQAGNKTLDALVKGAESESQVTNPDTGVEGTEKGTETPPSAIKALNKQDQKQEPEKSEQKVVEKKEGDENENAQEQNLDDDDDIDLETLTLNIEGRDRTVQDLLNERDALIQKFNEITKDPFLKGFIEHYMNTGNASAYLEAKGVDWDKRDDIDVLRTKFDRDNADLDPKIREKLWRRKLADEYHIKPDLTQEEMESEDYEIAQGLLKRDANKARAEFKDTQSKFQIVDRKQEDKPQQQKFDPQAYRQQLLAEKEVNTFLTSKLLKLGIKNDSGQSFGFEPSKPEHIVEMMVNDRKFWETFIDPQSKRVDRVKQAKIYAYAMNPDEFEQQLVDFGKNLGLEERLKEVKNTDDRLNKKTTDSQTKEASFSKRFLTEALKQKK